MEWKREEEKKSIKVQEWESEKIEEKKERPIEYEYGV